MHTASDFPEMSTYGEHWSSMTAIERVRWIHSRFVENNERKSYDFRKECGLQLHMRGLDRHSERAVLTGNHNYFQLAYRTGRVWPLVDKIFEMWNTFTIKGQKTDINEDVDMKLTRWQHMQGIYDEAIVIPVLEKVVRRILSLKEMGQEFAQYKVEKMVQQHFCKPYKKRRGLLVRLRINSTRRTKSSRTLFLSFKSGRILAKRNGHSRPRLRGFRSCLTLTFSKPGRGILV